MKYITGIKLLFKRLPSLIKETFIWLWDGKIYLFGILVIGLSIYSCIFISTSEPSIRITGYLLQMLGMASAIKGLLSIRQYFQLKTYPKIFSDWFSKHPKWKKHLVINVGTSEITFAGMRARAEVWTPDHLDYPIEKRIEGIVKNIDRMRAEQSKQSGDIDKLTDSYEEQSKIISKMPKEVKSEINSNLKDLHTTDLSISLIGLVFLIVGITLSTLSPEISKFLNQ